MSDEENILPFVPKEGPSMKKTPKEGDSMDPDRIKGGDVIKLSPPTPNVASKKPNLRDPAEDPSNLALVARARRMREHFMENYPVSSTVWQYLDQNPQIWMHIKNAKSTESKKVWISLPPPESTLTGFEAQNIEVYEPLANALRLIPMVDRSKAVSALREWLNTAFAQEEVLPLLISLPNGGIYIEWQVSKK